ncbi:invertase 2 [Iris pallida]|uniref:Invertase 2 n=1 Tax=Iris pallida TaxID=29817 RepID=A0AAX6GDA6_IRIPA|nr:invertase 2 [Iris pallida]
MATPDLESPPPPLPHSYAPLPDSDTAASESVSASVSAPPLRSRSLLCSLALSFVFLLALAGLLSRDPHLNPNSDVAPDPTARFPARGVQEGVSSKSSGSGFLRSDGSEFPWTNHMLAWQRTGFHFQPDKNWMNDPNGPLYYKGWYHLFYQYNPDAAVWGNITWGHSVSRDLVNWQDLPLAMVRDRWYDINGVWTGSATLLPDGQVIMLYTGATNESVQVQNLAVPADLSDPLLLNWVKSEANPVLVPPPGIGTKDFRDPTTAWFHPSDSTWRFVIGSKVDDKHSGIALVYSTKDFLSYELLPGVLHAVEGVGMWECIDFYPVSTVDSSASNGLDTSVPPGDSVKHVIKESSDDDRHDYYAIGSYDADANKWTPDDAENDLGIGLRYDWGKFYASKTFYDQEKKRRVLWGWISETDSERTDIAKGWASLMGVPRTVVFDVKTGSNLLTWPVEEVDSLRLSSRDFSGITIDTGSAFPLHVSSATQLDIEAEFLINRESLEAVVEADVGYNCSTSGGAATRGTLGPFGLLVLANEEMSEQTATYFYYCNLRRRAGLPLQQRHRGHGDRHDPQGLGDELHIQHSLSPP